MGQLLDELVNLSKILAIKSPKRKFIFRELLKEAIEQIEQKVLAKNITIQVNSDFSLIYGNRKSLFDVILDLFRNATTYIKVKS